MNGRRLTRRDALRGLLALGVLACTAFTSEARPLPRVSPPAVEEAQLYPPVWFFDSPGAALRRDAVGLWLFENGSNLGLDSSAKANNLTNNNSVSQVAGKVGQAASFASASSQWLSIADNASLSITGAMTLAGWFRFTTIAGTPTLAGKSTATGNQRSYKLFYDAAASRFTMRVSNDGTAITSAQASTFGAASTATWYFVVGVYDGAALKISVNGGAQDSQAYSSGLFDSTAAFGIGGDPDSNFLNGSADGVGIWNRVLRPAEIAWLYNGGSGHALALLAPPTLLAAIVERLKRAA